MLTPSLLVALLAVSALMGSTVVALVLLAGFMTGAYLTISR